MDVLVFFLSTIFSCSKQKVIFNVCRDREILFAGGKSGSISRCLLLLVDGFLKTGLESSFCCLLLVLVVTGGEAGGCGDATAGEVGGCGDATADDAGGCGDATAGDGALET